MNPVIESIITNLKEDEIKKINLGILGNTNYFNYDDYSNYIFDFMRNTVKIKDIHVIHGTLGNLDLMNETYTRNNNIPTTILYTNKTDPLEIYEKIHDKIIEESTHLICFFKKKEDKYNKNLIKNIKKSGKEYIIHEF